MFDMGGSFYTPSWHLHCNLLFACLYTTKRAESSTIYVNVWIMQIDIKLDLPPPDCTLLYILVKIYILTNPT